MSDAMMSEGSGVQRWNTVNSAWESIALISAISMTDVREVVDASMINTGKYREFVSSFRDGGTVDLTLVFTRADYDAVFMEFDSDNQYLYRIIIPGEGLTVSAIEFLGFPYELDQVVHEDDQIQVLVMVKVNGVVTVYTYLDSTDFIITVDTTKAGSANDTFILPTYGAGYDAWVDWGDGSSENIVGSPGNVIHVYLAPGEYQIRISGMFPQIYFNRTGDKLKLISIDNWGIIQWASFQNAFWECTNMNCTATDSADTSLCSGNAFRNSFRACSSMTALNSSGWNTSNVIHFDYAFMGCTVLTALDTSGWDVRWVTTFYNTFSNCSSLATLDTSGWNTISVTNFGDIFYNCVSLTALDTSGWNTVNVQLFNGAFRNCTSLTTIGDTSGWNTANVTDITSMFLNCSSLQVLDVSGWNTSNVIYFDYVFMNCSSLQSLDVSWWNVSNGETFFYMFQNCKLITTLDVSGWNTANATDFSNFAKFCSSLKGDFSGLDLGAGLTTVASMFYGCDINDTGTAANYDATLIKFANDATINNLTGLVFHGGTSKYSDAGGGKAARAILTDPAGLNWSIMDGGELI